MEACRTVEGYYKIEGGVEYSIQRSKAYSPYADLIWMETSKPKLSQAQHYARTLNKFNPNIMLAYNLSPSFNWSDADMTDDEIQTFIHDLGKEGFVWQFITLAGFHLNGLATKLFAQKYAIDGMLAYVSMIQRKEAENNCEIIKHQKWSGSELVDGMTKSIMGNNSSTQITSDGTTEVQF